jgi:hypothetical protein
MELELIEYIIKNHKQKYQNSCVPMAIELVLKLIGKVKLSYYDLQKHKNDLSRGFKEFDGEIIEGVKMSHEFPMPRDLNFPLEDLFSTIQKELEEGRFVTCAWRADDSTPYHAYVIYGYDEEEFLAISTDFGRSEFEYITDMKTRLRNINGSDILTFKNI